MAANMTTKLDWIHCFSNGCKRFTAGSHRRPVIFPNLSAGSSPREQEERWWIQWCRMLRSTKSITSKHRSCSYVAYLTFDVCMFGSSTDYFTASSISTKSNLQPKLSGCENCPSFRQAKDKPAAFHIIPATPTDVMTCKAIICHAMQAHTRQCNIHDTPSLNWPFLQAQCYSYITLCYAMHLF